MKKTHCIILKVMVFAGTVKGKVFALVFVRGNMTHTDYKAIVKDNCIPNIKNLNGSTLDGITWQQDGANIHRNPKVNIKKAYLKGP